MPFKYRVIDAKPQRARKNRTTIVAQNSPKAEKAAQAAAAAAAASLARADDEALFNRVLGMVAEAIDVEVCSPHLNAVVIDVCEPFSALVNQVQKGPIQKELGQPAAAVVDEPVAVTEVKDVVVEPVEFVEGYFLDLLFNMEVPVVIDEPVGFEEGYFLDVLFDDAEGDKVAGVAIDEPVEFEEGYFLDVLFDDAEGDKVAGVAIDEPVEFEDGYFLDNLFNEVPGESKEEPPKSGGYHLCLLFTLYKQVFVLRNNYSMGTLFREEKMTVGLTHHYLSFNFFKDLGNGELIEMNRGLLSYPEVVVTHEYKDTQNIVKIEEIDDEETKVIVTLPVVTSQLLIEQNHPETMEINLPEYYFGLREIIPVEASGIQSLVPARLYEFKISFQTKETFHFTKSYWVGTLLRDEQVTVEIIKHGIVYCGAKTSYKESVVTRQYTDNQAAKIEELERFNPEQENGMTTIQIDDLDISSSSTLVGHDTHSGAKTLEPTTPEVSAKCSRGRYKSLKRKLKNCSLVKNAKRVLKSGRGQ